MLINFARGITKTMGHRLPSSTSHCFAERVRAAVPEALHPALLPLLAALKQMEAQIEDYDDKIEELAAEQYRETRWLRQVPGVGTLTSLTFVLTVGQSERFAHSRDVGAFLGLVPQRRQSGEQDPHLPISKCGDRYLRRLLVQCAGCGASKKYFSPSAKWREERVRGSVSISSSGDCEIHAGPVA